MCGERAKNVSVSTRPVRKGIWLKTILLVGILSILACVASVRVPIRPYITPPEVREDMVCFPMEDAKKQAIYILELEEALNQ